MLYRGFEIYPTQPLPPIPGWQAFAWTYVHKDYDGPEDNRHGYAPTAEACRAEIDERYDPPEGWQKIQAAKCGCGGSDDYCGCQNEWWPEKYGLPAETPTPAALAAVSRLAAGNLGAASQQPREAILPTDTTVSQGTHTGGRND